VQFLYRRSKGFSLLEALVALTLVSTALISLFSLQSVGISALHESHFNHQALGLLDDLVGRLQANPSGHYQMRGQGPSSGCAHCESPDEVARRDLFEWWRLVEQSPLPEPSAMIQREELAIAPDQVVIRSTLAIQWRSLEPRVHFSTACRGAGEWQNCLAVDVIH